MKSKKIVKASVRDVNFTRVLPELPMTLKDIDTYKSNYIGSELEKEDIKKAYLKYRGCLNQMATEVLFMDYTQEPRVKGIINTLILKGELPRFKNYAEDDHSAQFKRFRDYRKEETKALEMLSNQKSLQTRKTERLKRVNKIMKKYKPKRKIPIKPRARKGKSDTHVESDQSYLQSTVAFMGEVLKGLFL